VIGSDSGEIPFVVGEAGRIVAERDIPAWAAEITRLLDDPSERAQLSRRGLERALQYSVPVIARQYADFYTWLAERPIHAGLADRGLMNRLDNRPV
jgi:glycosyltransferase involved in cell wall biosynthesis